MAPELLQTVLDTTDARRLAEFWRAVLGWGYRAGDEPPAGGDTADSPPDWLVLAHPAGAGRLAFQLVDELPAATWPDTAVPQQLHLDLRVRTEEELAAEHRRVLGAGAQLLLDSSDDEEEPLYVYADPDGHPFCIFVAP